MKFSLSKIITIICSIFVALIIVSALYEIYTIFTIGDVPGMGNWSIIAAPPLFFSLYLIIRFLSTAIYLIYRNHKQGAHFFLNALFIISPIFLLSLLFGGEMVGLPFPFPSTLPFSSILFYPLYSIYMILFFSCIGRYVFFTVLFYAIEALCLIASICLFNRRYNKLAVIFWLSPLFILLVPSFILGMIMFFTL